MTSWDTHENVHVLDSGLALVTGPASNWVVVGTRKSWLLVDGGYPGDGDRVMASARAAGIRGFPEAVLLTHAHVDHVGAARRLAAHGVPVWCAAAELGNGTGETLSQIDPETAYAKAAASPLWGAWVHHAVEAGGLDSQRLRPTQLRPFAARAGEVLDLPGHPVVIPSTGHTPGHTSFRVGPVLVGGDAVVTAHPTSPVTGRAQLLDAAFQDDCEATTQAARRLCKAQAEVLAPGHGPALPMAAVREGLRSAHVPVDL
ncbi:MBL fold metallo-hydrolase [Kocuria rhizophila]|uniref:MBL fold metallo-hydrolase n=1 Tax=Kocuria rhizophila TaxID=72000 RepID=UPI0009E9E11E|nr:MBL fold metallo-hydrolase [Kocuria rhizophila]